MLTHQGQAYSLLPDIITPVPRNGREFAGCLARVEHFKSRDDQQEGKFEGRSKHTTADKQVHSILDIVLFGQCLNSFE